MDGAHIANRSIPYARKVVCVLSPTNTEKPAHKAGFSVFVGEPGISKLTVSVHLVDTFLRFTRKDISQGLRFPRENTKNLRHKTEGF